MTSDTRNLAVILALGTLVLSACGSASRANPEPTVSDTVVATELPTEIPPTNTPEPKYTEIVIDGDPSDWAVYDCNTSDRLQDSQGGPDFSRVCSFVNDKYLYVLAEFADPSVDLTLTGGHYEIVVKNSTFVYNKQYNIFLIEGKESDSGQMAVGSALEGRISLETLSGAIPTSLAFFSVIEAGGIVVDDVQGVKVIKTDELEPIHYTQIVIDGDLADWARYGVTFSDDLGDPKNEGPDISSVTYFVNDKFLYVEIAFAKFGPWDDISVGLSFEDGTQGQINLRADHQTTIRIYGPNVDNDLIAEYEFSKEGVELKVALALLPSLPTNLFSIRVFNHSGGFGDNEIELAENNILPSIPTVSEIEP